ncbi:YheC/YheD family protein [Bacillus salitolerans]|uniref:YheC/YheD family protein n=1 Tax=Bacillus salitolerans TaxID=1437434 RepID=A0ABW4LM19_9BACI
MEKNLGIFISIKHYQKLVNGNRKCSHYFYEKEASLNNISLYYISLPDVKIEKPIKTKALLFDPEQNIYREEFIPLPRVIYNRVHLRRKKYRRMLKHMLDLGYEIYNSIPFYGKHIVNQYLGKNEVFHPFLPKTLTATKENIHLMMKHFNQLFVKPSYSSLGRGIMFIGKDKNQSWTLHYQDHNKEWKQTAFSNSLPTTLLDAISKKPFIVQEKIPLATFNGRTFDTRVIVQRTASGEWAITGMVGKLAQSGHNITNVGSGGDFAPIQTYLEGNRNFSPDVVRKRISELALSVAHYLEQYCYHIADLGMDIGITDEGKPYFIECNFRSQYSGMETDSSLQDVCRNLYANPIRYGNYLLQQGS